MRDKGSRFVLTSSRLLVEDKRSSRTIPLRHISAVTVVQERNRRLLVAAGIVALIGLIILPLLLVAAGILFYWWRSVNQIVTLSTQGGKVVVSNTQWKREEAQAFSALVERAASSA